MLSTNNVFRFSESDHCYWLIKDGKETPLCGTTRILSILDKPGLTWWASSLVCAEFGWLNPKKNELAVCLESAEKGLAMVKAMSVHQYLTLLDKAYRAHATRKEEAKDKGVDMHAALEDYIKAHMAGRDTFLPDPVIEPFVQWSKKNVKRFLFSEMCCYSEILHVGGTSDFGYEDMAGNYVLGDFKSSASVYWNMSVQLGAYDLQISENGGYEPNGRKVFELSQPFAYYAVFAQRKGLDKPFFFRDIARLKRAFGYCVHLYQEKLFLEDFINEGYKR